MSPRWTDNWLRLTVILVAMGLTACGGSKPVAETESTEVAYPADATTRYQRALGYMDAGDDQRASAELEYIARTYPEYAGPYVNLAIIHERNGRVDEAKASLQKAIEICSGCANAYNQLGILQRREGLFIDAEQSYLAAIEADPEYALAYFNLGVLYDLYQGRPELALRYYEEYKTHHRPAAVDQKDIVDTWIIDLRRRVGEPQKSAEAAE